ncbi:acetyltransferase [Spiroplasma endosymbiont of Sarcophaga variegata]|uniref:acetyltransferase n=1 Tax=Spiroplasma endosymbiont of Sarcophaga variegata TaxID=3066304 RepID=UPI003AF949DB
MLFNKLKKKDEQDTEPEDKKLKKRNLLQEELSEPDNLETSLFEDDENEGKIKTGFSFKRHKTHKIIKELNRQRIKSLLFYTDTSNVLRQLEFGLQPVQNIHLAKESEYIVWTYLEKPDHLEFELDNSTRHYFWSWVAEQKVDPSQIAVIAIDIKKLFALTKKDWEYDDVTRRIRIFEDVNPEAIRWILMKNNQYLNRIQTYVESNCLNLKIFQGEKGNISDLLTENRKK